MADERMMSEAVNVNEKQLEEESGRENKERAKREQREGKETQLGGCV